MKFFEELRFGKKDEGPDDLYYDRTDYEEDDDLYFDRSRYGFGVNENEIKNRRRVLKQVQESNHVTFEVDKVKSCQ